MEIESKFRSLFAGVMDQLNEQPWFQELRTKWEELDPQSKIYLKIGAIAGITLSFLFLVLSALWSVSALKGELNEKTELLTMIRNATEEIKTLKTSATSSQASQGGAVKWDQYFNTKAASAGIDAGRLVISPEKQGNPGASTVESMFTVELNRINVKQAVQYAYSLESGPEPVKVKNLRIQTVGDEGWLNARLEVSAFAMKKETK